VGQEARSREAVQVKDRDEVKTNEVTMCPEVSSSREDGEGRSVPVVRRIGLLDEDRPGSRTSGEEVHPKSGMTQCANSSEFSGANVNYCSPDLFPPSSPNVDSTYYTASVERKKDTIDSRCPEDQQLCSEEKTERRSEANAKVG